MIYSPLVFIYCTFAFILSTHFIAASEWLFRVGEHQNYLGAWRQYASNIEQGLEFEELSTIDVDEGIE